MDYTIAIFDKAKDKQLLEATASEDGVLAILRRMTSCNGHQQANFMHELRTTGASHILEESNLPYEIVGGTA